MLTRKTPIRSAAERAQLRMQIIFEVDVLFVDEQSLLDLHLPTDLGKATAWMAKACEVGVISMGEEGLAIIRGREQVFSKVGGAAPELYLRGLVAGLRDGLPLTACAARAAAYAKGPSLM